MDNEVLKNITKLANDVTKILNNMLFSVVIMTVVICVAFTVSICVISNNNQQEVNGMVDSYFTTDYDYPTIEQSVTQEVKQKVEE